VNTARCNDTGEWSNARMMISRKKQRTLEENQLQCHSFHHESQIHLGLKPRLSNKKPASNNLRYSRDFLLLLLF
jgi:hypothetical protein